MNLVLDVLGLVQLLVEDRVAEEVIQESASSERWEANEGTTTWSWKEREHTNETGKC